uniref:Uncharacterized protein n=1 Tax=uncultured prokaryote TaxID=198431 RepID=A0A0H5Q325_9ZZZZ|nr:unnamed protein product [uncultured bacterium]CRY95785.1 hypothetical protein [uncultured prokaryote]
MHGITYLVRISLSLEDRATQGCDLSANDREKARTEECPGCLLWKGGRKKSSPLGFQKGGGFFLGRVNFKRYFWVIYVVAFTCKESAFPLEAINPMLRNCPVGAFIFLEGRGERGFLSEDGLGMCRLDNIGLSFGKRKVPRISPLKFDAQKEEAYINSRVGVLTHSYP